MCLIIDANRAASVFAIPPGPDFSPIFDWFERDGAMVYGGRAADELWKVGAAARYIQELKRQGKAFQRDQKEIARETAAVKALGHCCSNDEHIIALARVSGARVLCTEDAALMTDFKNPDLIKKPRGKIYRQRTHKRVLGHSPSCPWRRSR